MKLPEWPTFNRLHSVISPSESQSDLGNNNNNNADSSGSNPVEFTTSHSSNATSNPTNPRVGFAAGHSYTQELRDLARLLQNPAVEAVVGWLLRVSPFLVIFLMKWTIEHFVRIVLICTAVYAFIDCNVRLTRHHRCD